MVCAFIHGRCDDGLLPILLHSAIHVPRAIVMITGGLRVHTLNISDDGLPVVELIMQCNTSRQSWDIRPRIAMVYDANRSQ